MDRLTYHVLPLSLEFEDQEEGIMWEGDELSERDSEELARSHKSLEMMNSCFNSW